MNLLEVSRAIAQALKQGRTVEEVKAMTGLDETTILNMQDNANSRNYTEINTMNTTTRKTFDSSILANAFNFEVQKLGRSYLKKKDAALKGRGAQQTELIEEAKQARAAFAIIAGWAPEETSFADIVTEYCGLGREWNASGKMVKEFADANGVDQTLAAELVTRQMTVAQDYAQATRGVKFGRYLSWLEDAAADAEPDQLPANMEELVLDAYNRAAQWNQPGDGLLIREFAESIGVSEILPTWAECLQKNMPSAEAAMEARKRISNRAQAAAAAEQEAEQELIAAHGAF